MEFRDRVQMTLVLDIRVCLSLTELVKKITKIKNSLENFLKLQPNLRLCKKSRNLRSSKH